ncbi:MAG TPA: molybdopterin-dependent oxidoreductase, partial [Burkholderiales bacterium]|nr:molybdopterin-dependent oxidoreductase [Burkholderiales bacterium]
HSVDDDWLMPIAGTKIVAPSEILNHLSSFKEKLSGAKNGAILLGNFAQQHPRAAQIHAAAQALARSVNAKVGFLGEAANSLGGYVAGLPVGGNLNDALAKKALIVLNAEPQLDCADPQAAAAALQAAEFVVALSAFRSGLEYANVILPIGAFTETAGSFVNTEGRLQPFYATVNPPGETRPGWKVLRVLGTMLGAPGFELDDVEQVRAACLEGRDISSLLSNEISIGNSESGELKKTQALQRIAEVPLYFADPLVRRSPPLQATKDAAAPKAWMNAATMARLGLTNQDEVLIRQGSGEARLKAALDDKLPDECVRVAAAHASTSALGAMFGTVSLQKAAMGKAA